MILTHLYRKHFGKTIFNSDIPSKLSLLGFVIIALFLFNRSLLDQVVPTCRGCNVILISVDTFGAKHLGLYGYTRPTTPHLDELAKERGVVFNHAFSQASWTLPSHTAMLTGQYPAKLGMWVPLDKLPSRAVTLAEILKQDNFVTQAFSNGFFVQPEWGFDQGFDGFSGSLDPKAGKDSPKIFEDALGWLGNNNKKPFFLFMRPWHMNGKGSAYSKQDLNSLGIQSERDRPGVGVQDIIMANTRPSGPTAEENDRFRDGYDVKVRQVDQGLFQFFQGIDNLGLSKKTVVIIVADHGEEFGEHGTTRFHDALYDETTHVPLIIFLPGSKPQRVDNVVELRSLPATILDLLGLKSEPSFEGTSLVNYLHNNVGVPTSPALSVTALGHEFFFQTDSNNKTNLEKTQNVIGQVGKTVFPKERSLAMTDPFASSARTLRWQLIRHAQDNFELYDLLSDPVEQKDLFPTWSNLPSEDRREIIKLFSAVGADVPVGCGIYCNGGLDKAK